MKWSGIGSTDDAVRRIWAERSTSVWATGGTTLKRWNGTSTSSVTTGIALEPGETYLDVGGSGGSDVWAITSKRNLHFDGTSWKAYSSAFAEADTIARVISFGPSDTWVFRGMGRFAHFDGTSFKAEPQAPTIDWAGCIGGGQMLAVSQNPATILRGAPLGMTNVSDTFPDYHAIDVAFGASGNAWLLGDNAAKHQLAYFDGTTLRESVDATTRSYGAIWALPSGEAWAVGSGGILHRKP